MTRKNKAPRPRRTAPGKRVPPRRRDAPQSDGRPAQDADLGRLGYPLAVALRGPAADIEQSTKEVGRLAAKMGLGPAPESGPAPAPGPGQISLCDDVAQGLHEQPRMQERTGVTPGTLLRGREQAGELVRAKRLCAAGQNLAADGRLFLGSRFSFYFGRVRKAYRRMLEGTPAEQLRALALFGKMDTTRFRLLSRALEAREATEKQKLHIATTIAERQDESAFHRVLALMADGKMPDAETLLQATRHADRLQDEIGLGLEEGATSGAP